MTTPNFALFEEMLAAYHCHGAVELNCTVHTMHALRSALAVLRRKNESLHAVQLSVKHLDPHECYRASTGGLVVMCVTLKEKKEGELARGRSAEMLRTVGGNPDGQTFATTPSLDKLINEEARVRQEERERYAEWRSAHPAATHDDKVKAGFARDAENERLLEEMRGGPALVKPKEDFFADFGNVVLRDDFDPTKAIDKQEEKEE